MNSQELEIMKQKEEDKKRTRELITATLQGYNLAREHYRKFGKFLGTEKLENQQ